MSTNPENTHTSQSIGARDAQVERWEPDCGCYTNCPMMDGRPDGDYVRFTDFESVRQERDRLRTAFELNSLMWIAQVCQFSSWRANERPLEEWPEAACAVAERAIAYDAEARAALNQSDAQ